MNNGIECDSHRCPLDNSVRGAAAKFQLEKENRNVEITGRKNLEKNLRVDCPSGMSSCREHRQCCEESRRTNNLLSSLRRLRQPVS